MRPVRTAAAAFMVAAAAMTTAGCAAVQGDDSSLVGVAMPTTTLLRWGDDGEDVQEQLENLGYDVDLRYAENDVATQVQQLGEMIDAGADLLIVGAIDGTALKDQLARAAAADIPVVSYDRLIRDTPDIAYYATFDNLAVGVMQGHSLARAVGLEDAEGNKIEGAGPFTLELFAGSPDDNNATVFYEGAMSVLDPYISAGDLVITSGEKDFATIATEAWDAAKSGERMAALLTEHYAGGERPDAVLAPNDGIAISVIEAIRSHGAPAGAVVTGQDAELASVKSIVAGEQTSTVYKNTQLLAEVAVSMGHALLSGREPETNDLTSYDNGVKVVPTMLLAPQLVTQDNLERVLVESGAFTAEEIR